MANQKQNNTEQVKYLLHGCAIHAIPTGYIPMAAVCANCGASYTDLPVGAQYRLLYADGTTGNIYTKVAL